jgi:hypothetical protein
MYQVSVLMNSSHTLSLYTVTQNQLTLDYGAQGSLLAITSPSVQGDNYWYDSGTNVSFTGAVEFSGFVVTGWQLDALGTNPVLGGAIFNPTAFPMTEPHTLSVAVTPSTGASCGSQSCTSAPVYDITVQAGTNATGGVWVDGKSFPDTVTLSWPAGSIHNVTASLGQGTPSVRTHFSHWSGDSDSQSASILIDVNGSGFLTAEYTTQYLVTLAFTDAHGAPLTPQSLTVSGPDGAMKFTSNPSLWAGQGTTYRLASVVWMDSNVVMANASEFTARWPGTLTFPLMVYPQVVKATDAYNLPLQGATVNITTSDGRVLSMVTDAQGTAQFRVPYGIYTMVVSYLGVSEQVVPSVLGSHSYTMSFLLSYPLVATVGAVTALACAFVVYRLRKRPDFQNIYYFDDS